MGGVDVAVARAQGGEARLLAHLVGALQEGAQSEAGHLHAVVQLDHGHAGGRCFLLCVHHARAAHEQGGSEEEFFQ